MTNKFKGAIFILISAFFYATYGIWSRLMGSSFGEFTQAWTRGLFLFSFIFFANLKFHFIKPFKRQDWPWFIAIALAGGLNQAPYYFGFQHLEIGTATLLFYASLVVGGYILGKFCLKEIITFPKIFSLAISILGMILIYRFSLRPDQILAALLTCLAGFLGSATVVLTKKLSGQYHEFQIMTGYFTIQVLFNGPISQITNEVIPAFTAITPWLAQLGYAAAMLIANLTAIEGFKHLEGSIGSLIGMAEIIFGVLFGFLFFGEILTNATFIGGVLIILAAAFPSIIAILQSKK